MQCNIILAPASGGASGQPLSVNDTTDLFPKGLEDNRWRTTHDTVTHKAR